MGTYQHKAVIATTEDPEDIENIRHWIETLSEEERQLIGELKSWIGGYRTFVLGPDGGSCGGETSDKGDNLRDRFISKVCGLNDMHCVELSFGDLDNELGAFITRSYPMGIEQTEAQDRMLSE